MFNMLVIGSAFVTQANRRLGIPASKTPAELTLPELRKLTAEMQSTARKLYQGEK